MPSLIPTRALRPLAALLITLAAALPAGAQLCWQFLALGPSNLPGTNGRINAIVEADLGQGPVLVVGGSFTQAGSALATNVAAWNDTSWLPVGATGGPTGEVLALAFYDDGRGPLLYAGGNLRLPENGPTAPLQRLRNGQWEAVATGFSGAIHHLAIYDGLLYIAGPFNAQAASGSFARLAAFDGAQLLRLGSQQTQINGFVTSLNVLDAGDGPRLFAGGTTNLVSISGIGSLGQLVTWDGAVFDRAAPGLQATSISSVAARDGALLIAGPGVRGPNPGITSALVEFRDGTFRPITDPSGFGLQSVNALLTVGDATYVGGQFDLRRTGAPALARNIALLDDLGWRALPSNAGDSATSGPVHAILVTDTAPRSLTIAGQFSQALGVNANNIVRGLDGIDPIVTTGPSRTAPAGTRVSVAANASGTGPFRFEWYRNGARLFDGDSVSGSSSATLVLDPFGPEHFGVYEVLALGPCAPALSRPFALAVTPTAPPTCPADFDASGDLAITDLFAYLTAFFAGCP